VAAFKARGKDRLVDLTAYLAAEDSILDAASIEEHLFPVTGSDIFLSHAHADEEKVIRLAVALERCGVNVFVDSCVWGDVYKLLKAVDDERSVKKDDKNTYHYHKAIRTSANVYMILNVALQRMIDQSELFLFLATDGVKMKDYVDAEGKQYLGSPWIFAELEYARTVRRRARPSVVPALEGRGTALAKTEDSALKPFVRYEIPALSHAMEWSTVCDVMNQASLAPLLNDGKDNTRFLDRLYARLELRPAERELLRIPALEKKRAG